MQQSSSEPTKRNSSFSRLLLVWFLVGPSLFGLGWDLADAVPVTVPVSSMGAGLLFGTVLVAFFWVAGFRLSLSASGGYFITEMGLQYLLILCGDLFLFSGSMLSPWQEVLLRGLSIALAAAFVFTNSGRRVRDFVRKSGRKLVKTPPEADR